MPHDKGVANIVLDEDKPYPDDTHRAPGTFVLALIFLATFAVYFFANWIALSNVWQVR